MYESHQVNQRLEEELYIVQNSRPSPDPELAAQLKKITNENTQLKKKLTESLFKQNELEAQGADLDANNCKLEKKLVRIKDRAEAELQKLVGQVDTLELEVTRLHQQISKHTKLAAEAKNSLQVMSGKMMAKNAEMSCVKLSEERCLLEVNKLRKELVSEESMRVKADRFMALKETLKTILEKDTKFCQSDSYDENEMDDDQVFEVVNSILNEFSEFKEMHFTDVQNYSSQMKRLKSKKNSYKIKVARLHNKLTNLKENEVKAKEKKIQMQEKLLFNQESMQKANYLTITNLKYQIKEKDTEIKKLLSIKQEHDASERKASQSVQNTIDTLEKQIHQKKSKIKMLEENHQFDVATLQKEITSKDKQIELFKTKNVTFIQQSNTMMDRYKVLEQDYTKLLQQKTTLSDSPDQLTKSLAERDEIIEILQWCNLILDKKLCKQVEDKGQNKVAIKELKYEMQQKELDFVQKMKKYSSNLSDMRSQVTYCENLDIFLPTVFTTLLSNFTAGLTHIRNC